jgi:hypothetical protein
MLQDTWVLEGRRVQGLYLNEIRVTGMVTLSAVAGGGRVQHYVALDQPVEIYRTTRASLILKHNEIEQVFDQTG